MLCYVFAPGGWTDYMLFFGTEIYHEFVSPPSTRTRTLALN
jgi:hypothetical protein